MSENEHFKSETVYSHVILFSVCAILLISLLGILPVSAFNDYSGPWTLVNASAGWTARYGHSSAVMPDGSIVLMGGFDGVWKNDVWRSTDNGATWMQVNASAGWTARGSHSSVVMPDGSIELMGGRDSSSFKNDVWRSTDNGTTWTLVNASAGWTARGGHSSVAISAGNLVLMGGTYNIGFYNDTWRSTDNGATWTLVNASSGWEARYYHSSVNISDGSIVLTGGFAAYEANRKNDTWRSTDNGATWTLVNASSGWTVRWAHSSVATPDKSIVLMGGSNGLSNYKNDVWQSTDNGATWTQVNASAGWTARAWHSSVAMPDGSIVLMGGSNGLSNYKNDVWRLMPNQTTDCQPMPVANFMATPTTGPAPLTVQFTDQSTPQSGPNPITSWTWTFGDGSLPVITQNPTHVYQNAGHYLATLTVQNACGTNTTSSYIDVTNSSGSCCCCCSACSTCPPITGCGDNVIHLFGMPINIWLIIWTILVAVLIAGIVYYLIKRADD